MTVGAQRPRVSSVPPRVTSAGREAVELAASAGLLLDPWQAWVLDESLGERADGVWSAFEVGLVVPRQNGKGSVLEARELAGLFLFGEELILHSAHEFKTAAEAFRRVLALVENTDDLRRRVARVRTSHGEEGIELRSGARLRFVARSTGSGRGFSGDCVILDEAYNLTAEAMAALLPTMSARPNPQLWYTSSAGMEASTQLRAVRERGIAGQDPHLAYFEWSAQADADPDDAATWAVSNPALGIRIPVEFVERERSAMPPAQFARERLGVWSDALREAVIPVVAWSACADPRTVPLDPVTFALDVTPDRGSAAVAVAGATDSGRLHVEVVEHQQGTAWLVPRMVELVARWPGSRVAVDPGGPAGTLLVDLVQAGIEPLTPSVREFAQACGAFHDAVVNGELRHRDQAPLNAAVAGASKRRLGESWAWDRRAASVDICPLVAVTVAAWGHRSSPPPIAPSVHFV